jgi:tetratricopeptide (TPR) repeat protein
LSASDYPSHDDRASCNRSVLELALLFILLAGVTAAVYSPVLSQQFSDWDDPKHIKAIWKPGWERAWKIVTDFNLEYTGVAYYSPVHFLSLMAEQAAIGAEGKAQPWIAKLMNLVYHIGNTLLLFMLLTMLGIERRSAFIGALVFAVHPVQVGTVAWVAERKNLLATLFYLSATITYIKYAHSGKSSYFPIVILLFVAGLLSKPAVVTLPVALIAWLLICPEQRPSGRGLFVVLGAMLGLALIWGLYTVSTEVSYAGILPPWPYRPLLAAGAIWFYLAKFIYPIDLVVVYPKWNVVHQWWQFSLLLLALAALLGVVIRYWKRLDPLILWGLALFLINILPVAGFVPFGHMGHSYVADHFLYLPMVGLSLVTARALELLLERIHGRAFVRNGLIVGSYLLICLLGLLSVRQTWLWSEPEHLWEATLKVNTSSPAVYNNYGWICMERGELHKAMELFQRASQLAPGMEAPYQNMGRIYHKLGERDKALKMFRKAGTINPKSTYPRIMVGYMLREDGKFDKAIAYFRHMVSVDPTSALLRVELALSYNAAGMVNKALAELDQAMKANPLEPSSYVHKATILSAKGNLDQAAHLLRRSLHLEPNAEAHNMLGTLYARQGKMSLAFQEFIKAYTLKPELIGIRDNVARSLLKMKQLSRARAFCSDEARAGRPCSENMLKELSGR